MSLRVPRGNVIRLFLAVAGLLLTACTEPIVFGSIPPSTFQFTPIVAHRGRAPGGWKVSHVVILLGRLSPVYPETAVCDIEVGVPEVTEGAGVIATTSAQRVAAQAADEAARHVLKKRLPTAVACNEFRATMQSFMIDPTRGNVPGTRVSRFKEVGIPQTTFP
ncbi:hypothetical protein [Hyalangium gracile]|uniref:hypothetical protein n=1 Tax=Hyalangium gracile TaxID=394092 RepID=UPI001CCF1825|nr:hypothetical protein [Hyalangium gracile]